MAKESELKVIKIELNNHGKPIASIQGTTSYYGISPNDTFYPKSEADKVIAELKAENRRLKRALYKTLSNWALSTLAWLDCIDQGNPAKWSEMHRKCLSKVEEYK